MQARMSDLERLRANGDELEPCDASERALILVKRAGIHPHFVQSAVARLLRAFEELMKTRKRWMTT
jgi:hypothetical protein